MYRHLTAVACLTAAIVAGQEPTSPTIAPAVLQSAEDKYATEVAKGEALVAKAEAESAKSRKLAADARLKAYKERLVEVTKAGDFDKAVAVKARIEQLEKEPDSDRPKPTKRPRPKDVVKFGGHTYALIKEPATWHVAKQRCEEMGGHLVCLETAAEDSFVRQLCGQETVWAGASDEESEGNWVWVYKGSPVKVAIRLDNAGDADHHLALFGNIWHDGHAGTRYSFVCEWEH